MSGFLKPLTEEYLEMVLEWRNSGRIRINMYHDEIITLDNHIKWFKKIKILKTEKYFLFFLKQKPVGLVYFNDISIHYNHAMWGFYIGDIKAPKGAGLLMGLLAIDYGFENLHLHKINGEVLKFNVASINFHKKLGFTMDGILRDEFKRNNHYYDVIKFSLLKEEWKSHKSVVLQNLIDKGLYVV